MAKREKKLKDHCPKDLILNHDGYIPSTLKIDF